MPSVAIVAGEASGDASGASLAAELRRLSPKISLWGAGGSKMRDAGVELVADFSWVGSIGVVESLKVVPRMLGELSRMKQALLKRRPDVFVPIDFGAFNVPLGKFARANGIPTVYYFPPGSWRRRPRDVSRLLAASDKIITPFPWSEELLKRAGADVSFFGHPMLDSVAPTVSRRKLLSNLRVRGNKRVVGLLPGSRVHEIRNILPALLRAATLITKELPDVATYLMPASSGRAMREMARIMARIVPGEWRRKAGESDEDVEVGDDEPYAQYRVIDGNAYNVMAHSDLLITCSGTATLEAMILGTPMIIVYRGSRMMKFEYLLRRGILEEYIGMPNIVAGREICPELLGERASAEAIAKLATSFLEKPEEQSRIREELSRARAMLGKAGAAGKAARLVLEVGGLLSSA